MDQEAREESLKRLRTEADVDRLAEIARSLHPADIASAVEEMDAARRLMVFLCLEDSAAAEVLDELEPATQQAVLALLPLSRTSDIVEEMPPDEAADLLGEMTETDARAILGAMESEDAADVEELLDYEADTAGGQMTTEFIAVSESLTVEETIQQLRELAPEAETVYYLFVVDPADRLVGIVSLRSLILSEPGARVADVMCRDVISISADADQEEAAALIARYNLVAVPVLDDQGRPIGIITVDDVVDVIDEEATEDIYELGPEEEPSNRPHAAAVGALLRGRAGRFLGVLAVALAAGGVLQALLDALSDGNHAASMTQRLVAAFLPAMLTLSWLFESQARASVMSRLAVGRDHNEALWHDLPREVGVSLVLAVGCAVSCAGALYAAQPGSPAALIGASLGIGLAASAVAAYLFPRLLLAGAPSRDKLPAGVTIAAHAVGMLAYLGSAFWIMHAASGAVGALS